MYTQDNDETMVPGAVCYGFGGTWYQRSQCDQMSQKIKVIEASAAELWKLRVEIAAVETLSDQLRAIAAEATVPPWQEIRID